MIAHARNAESGSAALAGIRARVPHARLELLTADPADPAEIRALAAAVNERHQRLDVLINNAAMAAFRPDQAEKMFATNVIAPFLLTDLLLPLLKRSAPARVVVIGSNAHKQVRRIPWDDLPGATTYALSKILNILFTYELARRLDGSGVTANVADPGFVRTNLGRDVTGGFGLFFKLVKPFMSTPEKGAATPGVPGHLAGGRRCHRGVLRQVPAGLHEPADPRHAGGRAAVGAGRESRPARLIDAWHDGARDQRARQLQR